MNITEFVSGSYRQNLEYNSFVPSKIHHEWIISDPEITSLLSKANRTIGELNAYSQIIPDVDFFIEMHILKEATTSSRIEGTKTNMEEALIPQEDLDPEKRDDWGEVQNYVKAINFSITQLNDIPISNRLLKNTHRILLSGVRGKHKLPGEYRKSQNWIGPSLKNAIFIPPHDSELDDLMYDLEKFVHDDRMRVPHLIKIALLHYQFETIHPFLDGNGRLGRLLITLYLVSKGILVKPALYLSDFFERNRTLYYDNLTGVREKDDLAQWFKFFLVGVIETAKSSISTFDSVLKLKEEVEVKIQILGSRSRNAQLIIKHLYQKPIIDAQKIKTLTSLSLPSVYKLIDELEKLKILEEITGAKRGKIYLFRACLNLFN